MSTRVLLLVAAAALACVAGCTSDVAGTAASPGHTVGRPTPTVRTTAPTLSASPVSAPKLSTTPVAFHAVQAAAASGARAGAMCRALFADAGTSRSLFGLDADLSAIEGRPTRNHVLDCVYPTSGSDEAGLEIRVGTKETVYDGADASMALYDGDVAVSADWGGSNTVEQINPIRDYLQSVLDRVQA